MIAHLQKQICEAKVENVEQKELTKAEQKKLRQMNNKKVKNLDNLEVDIWMSDLKIKPEEI